MEARGLIRRPSAAAVERILKQAEAQRAARLPGYQKKHRIGGILTDEKLDLKLRRQNWK